MAYKVVYNTVTGIQCSNTNHTTRWPFLHHCSISHSISKTGLLADTSNSFYTACYNIMANGNTENYTSKKKLVKIILSHNLMGSLKSQRSSNLFDASWAFCVIAFIYWFLLASKLLPHLIWCAPIRLSVMWNLEALLQEFQAL